MKDQSTLIHLEYESDKSYDTVIAAFEATRRLHVSRLLAFQPCQKAK